MENTEHHEVVIIGGGICGLAIALALHRKGVKSLVLERFQTLRATGAAMIMLPNGWRALNHLQVSDSLRNTAIPITAGYRVYGAGKRDKLPLGDDEIRCLKRQDLVSVLFNDLPQGTVRFGCRVVSLKINAHSRSVIQLDDGRTISASMVVGCDGVHSIVSDELGLSPMKVTNTSAIRGFTEYPNGHNLPPEFIIHTNDDGQFGYIPITENSVYWFVTRIKKTQDSHIVGDKPQIMSAALEFIEGRNEKEIEMVKRTEMDMLVLTTNLILRSPFDLLTNTFRKGRVIVAGDALHAMGPFLAQGGSLSLEDAVIFAKCVAPVISNRSSGTKGEKGIEEALDQFFKLRQMRAFWMMSHTYLMGIVAGTVPYKLVRFIGILLFIIFFSRDPTSHTRFDCGPL